MAKLRTSGGRQQEPESHEAAVEPTAGQTAAAQCADLDASSGKSGRLRARSPVISWIDRHHHPLMLLLTTLTLLVAVATYRAGIFRRSPPVASPAQEARDAIDAVVQAANRGDLLSFYAGFENPVVIRGRCHDIRLLWPPTPSATISIVLKPIDTLPRSVVFYYTATSNVALPIPNQGYIQMRKQASVWRISAIEEDIARLLARHSEGH